MVFFGFWDSTTTPSMAADCRDDDVRRRKKVSIYGDKLYIERTIALRVFFTCTEIRWGWRLLLFVASLTWSLHTRLYGKPFFHSCN